MFTLKIFTRTFILLLIVIYAAFSTDLTEKQRLKLHPLFQSLISHPPQPLFKTSSRSHRITSTVASDGTLRYSAIVYTRDVETLRSMGIQVNSVLPEFVTAQLTPSEMIKLADLESVKFLDPGKVHHPMLDVSVPETGAKLLHSGFINNTPYKGAGAIVLIYDTGIDWKHFDFRKAGDTTKSRILSIWDQTLTAGAGESKPSGFSYGVEYTQSQIEGELSGSARGIVREKDIDGHGTHVASTAAGNGQAFNNKYTGMAPEADIIIVKGGDGSFSSAGEIDGLTYAQHKANALHKPIVVNMSLGGQVGSHDGTNDDEVAVDNFVNTAGHVVCIAAGNDGANAIHINGSVSNGSPDTISINVPFYSPYTPGASNNYFVFDVWLQNNKALSALVKSPNSIIFSSQLNNEVYGPNHSDGSIDIYDETDPQNSHRHLQVYIYDSTSSVPRTGTWTITLSTTDTSTITYDAWIDSDLGGSSASLQGGNTNETVAMPGTAGGAITVASYVTKWSWTDYTGNSWYYGSNDRTSNISTFSSIGPTADSRQKPDIAAPGQGIVAALSSNDVTESTPHIIVNNEYLLEQGTSMATPHVTGGVALLLGAKPTLTVAQIKNYFTNTARIDAFTSTVWNASWGNGKMDIYKAMAIAVGASGANRTSLSYYSGTTVAYTPITSSGNQKVAIRFTPPTTGKLASVAVNLNSGVSAIKGTGNLKVTATQSITGSTAFIPGTQIGTSVLVPFSSLSSGVANVIDFSSAGVSVTSGTDFQIVLENTNVGDTLQVLLDNNASSAINRTSSYRTGATGTLGWYNRADPNYASSYTPTYLNLFITAEIAASVTDVERISNALPTSFMLKQNYPNPFNPSTNIEYSIPLKGAVKLQVFDILGRSVATLVDGVQDAGIYHTTWIGKTNNGIAMSSGVYFYRLESGSFSKTERMLLLK